MTTPKAINDIVTALGGESSADKTVPALEAVYAALGGDGAFPDTIPEALEMIASVAEPPVPEPTGAISITANGNDIDVAQYATANVNVPASAVVSGTKSITANGTGIDVTNYAAADVAVPASAVVSGTKSITANGTGIDVTEYASVNVDVSMPLTINVRFMNSTGLPMRLDDTPFVNGEYYATNNWYLAADETKTAAVSRWGLLANTGANFVVTAYTESVIPEGKKLTVRVASTGGSATLIDEQNVAGSTYKGCLRVSYSKTTATIIFELADV